MAEEEEVDMEKLARVYGEIRKDVVQSAAYLCQEAIRFAEGKKFDEAIELFKKAVETDPKYGYAWSDMGICMLQSNRPELLEEAEKALTRATELIRDDYKNWENLVVVRSCLLRFEAARGALAGCRRLEPTNPRNDSLEAGIKDFEEDDRARREE